MLRGTSQRPPSWATVVLSLAGLLGGCGDTGGLRQIAGEDAGSGVGCDRVASPRGSNSGPGTKSRPLRTVQKLIDVVAPGQTACLRAGTYHGARPYGDGHEEIRVAQPGITLTSYPGERATVVGRLRIEVGADRVTVSDLRLVGTNAHRNSSPTVNADGVVLKGNEITNGNTGICVHVGNDYGAAAGTLIERNRIHHCGQVSPRTDKEHGIYVADADGTRILHNRIHDNADRGVQLYPDADRTLVASNLIDGNGEGVVISGDETNASDHNTVRHNLITNSQSSWNVYGSWRGPRPAGNVVAFNCVGSEDTRGYYDQDGGILRSEAYEVIGNRMVSSRYTGRDVGASRTRLLVDCTDPVASLKSLLPRLLGR